MIDTNKDNRINAQNDNIDYNKNQKVNQNIVSQRQIYENLQKRIPAGLLLKYFSLSHDLSPEALKKLHAKNIYPKDLVKKKPESFFNLEKKSNQILFPRSKLLKYTKTIYLSTIEDFRGSKKLRTLRNLKSFTCTPSNESEVMYVIDFLKALPKSLERLSLSLQQKFLEIEWQSIVKIYKAIYPLLNLTTLHPFYQLGEESENYIDQEFRCMKKYLPRFSKLKEFGFRQEFYGQTGYQRVMRESTIYPQVTDLSLTVSEDLLPNTNDLKDYFVQEKSVQGDEPQGFEEDFLDMIDDPPEPSIIVGEGKKREEMLMREEILPFFRFEAFPNLKFLTLNFDFSHTLSEFVIDSFKNLIELKDFKLKLEVRPKGTIFFFKAFFELSQLNLFSLGIPFINPEEWLLLEKFINSQEKLTSFELNLSQARSSVDGYNAQNQALEKFIASLDLRTNLKSLELNSKFASLQTISNGLNQMKTQNKIQTLRIEAFDNQYSALDLQGFYDFMQRNSSTLSKLELNLPYIMNVEAIEKMLERISTLKKVSSLTLQFNSDRLNSLKNFIKYLYGTIHMKKTTLEESYFYYKKNFRPNLIGYFREMPELEEVTMSIGGLEKVKNKEGKKWFVDIFKQLKELKILKNFCFSMPFDKMDESSIEDIKKNLGNLKRNVFFTVNQTSREEQEDLVEQLNQIIRNINQRNQINNFMV